MLVGVAMHVDRFAKLSHYRSGGKTFHPGDPPNFDYPESWSNDTGYPPYYDFAYFLTASSKKNSMLPATNTTYTGICPGDCKSTGKGGSCTPQGETHATGGSLAGPIAVWCALDEPDEHFYDFGLGTGMMKHAPCSCGVTLRPVVNIADRQIR